MNGSTARTKVSVAYEIYQKQPAAKTDSTHTALPGHAVYFFKGYSILHLAFHFWIAVCTQMQQHKTLRDACDLMSWNNILQTWIITKQPQRKYSELQLKSKKFILPPPADWHGWSYPKRLITRGWNPDISVIPKQGSFLVHLNTYKDVVLNLKISSIRKSRKANQYK